MRDVLAYSHVNDPSLPLVENSTLVDDVPDSLTKSRCLIGRVKLLSMQEVTKSLSPYMAASLPY